MWVYRVILKKFLMSFIFFFFLHLNLFAKEALIDPHPAAVAINPFNLLTFINSVDFHPQNNLICVTYTHCNSVLIYTLNETGIPTIAQILSNPSSQLCHPQHAVFSPDGKKLVVANWSNQTFTVYEQEKNTLFCETPKSVFPFFSQSPYLRPHGLAFSPCGHYLGIAFGVTSCFERAIALFHLNDEATECDLISALNGTEELPGIPKGITFSPDGTCLLVTFSDVNSLAIYTIDPCNRSIQPTPRQIIEGKETGIFRPEDVKISKDGKYCALSNSDHHTVTFFLYDAALNYVTDPIPIYTLQNPDARLCFPHGLAFSPDGCFLVITEFGSVFSTEDGDIFWDNSIQPEQNKVSVFKLNQ